MSRVPVMRKRMRRRKSSILKKNEKGRRNKGSCLMIQFLLHPHGSCLRRWCMNQIQTYSRGE